MRVPFCAIQPFSHQGLGGGLDRAQKGLFCAVALHGDRAPGLTRSTIVAIVIDTFRKTFVFRT